MAKVFTITPGLENMGALKTGGQGSVYKGKRLGEIITAVKILPTPIYSESADDKHFTAFQNEVDKLRKVNQHPNPNVVKIINSGLTDSGSLPFIEMEFIEGPDLEELLQPPNDPIFTLKEVLKVAEQLSGALAHCHRYEVKHGDIKGNNVKFNSQTSNYILLDFGLALMSDEQRRSSLRQAGAIEFMAPEQNMGQMLFETDVYSFGIVLFELLAGSVPFPLKAKGETARNEVRLAHMVTPVPDLVQLRQQSIPNNWDALKKESEMQVPGWLVAMLNKCLQKKPTDRFANGVELHNYIVTNYINTAKNKDSGDRLAVLQEENKTLLIKQEQFKKQEILYRQEIFTKEEQIQQLKAVVKVKENQLLAAPVVQSVGGGNAGEKRVSKNLFISLLVCTGVVASCLVFFIYTDRSWKRFSIFGGDKKETPARQTIEHQNKTEATNKRNKEPINKAPKSVVKTVQIEPGARAGNKVGEQQNKSKNTIGAADSAKSTAQNNDPESLPETEVITGEGDSSEENGGLSNATKSNVGNTGISKKYLVVSKAWFYKEPEEQAKLNLYIGPEEKAVVDAIDERFGFVYVVVKDPQGKAYKGWLRKSDLNLYAIE